MAAKNSTGTTDASTQTSAPAPQQPANELPEESDRDWLARQVLPACGVTCLDDNDRFLFTPQQIARRCYAIADAILLERITNTADDDVSRWRAAFRDKGIRRAHGAWLDATAELSRIKVRSRPEFAHLFPYPLHAKLRQPKRIKAAKRERRGANG